MPHLYLVSDGTSLRLLYGRLDESGTPDPRWTSRFVPQADDVDGLRAQLQAGLVALEQEVRAAAPFSYPVATGMPGVSFVPPGGGQG